MSNQPQYTWEQLFKKLDDLESRMRRVEEAIVNHRVRLTLMSTVAGAIGAFPALVLMFLNLIN